ncbi:MAG: UDP-N-acetylmuramate dehydrogenase [Candidatus Gracilibacteria bacterium]
MALKDFPGVKQLIPLKLYSTFRVGGPADYFYSARDVESFLKISAEAKSENCRIFVLGNGSNVLFLDEGFRGLVIKMEMTGLKIKEDRLIAEAGATWPSILKVAEKAGLSGLEEMSGLPGTLGGAVCGNAGCFGKEMAQLVESALLYDPLSGKTKEVDQNYFNFRYRWSRLKETHKIVLRITLKLTKTQSDPEKTAAYFLQERAKKQPPGFSSGSFFKNPSPESPAGLLIDQCGLKGFRVGGAQISPKHANFFINTGMASAQDLLSLRDQVKKSVFDRFQIALEEEVIIVKNNP